VSEAEFSPARLDTMSTRNSAAYKGVLTLLMREGAIDWTYTRGPIDAAIYTDQQVDVALMFPMAWCDKNGIPREFRDSIVNKTPLSSRTRRTMGTRPPDEGGLDSLVLVGRPSEEPEEPGADGEGGGFTEGRATSLASGGAAHWLDSVGYPISHVRASRPDARICASPDDRQ
jgi:hypothetical protein